MEELKKQRGGKREGAGRKAVGISTHPMALKLDCDLFEILNQSGINKNRRNKSQSSQYTSYCFNYTKIGRFRRFVLPKHPNHRCGNL